MDAAASRRSHGGADGGEQRLDTDYQAGDAGRQAFRDRDEYAAEIDGVHQQARDADVEPLPRILRPRRTRGQRNQGHQRNHQQVADQQE